MPARSPISTTSLAWQITAEWAAKGLKFFTWPAGSADSCHVLLAGDTATRIVPRVASGATYDATNNRITGNSAVDFTFSVAGGLGGGMTERSNAYFGFSSYGSFPGGKNNPSANLFTSDATVGTGLGWHAGGSAGGGYDIVANIQNSSYVSARDGANGTPNYSINTQHLITNAMRYQTDDPIAKGRFWYSGFEAVAKRMNPAVPTPTTKIGDTPRPVVFGTSYFLDANTKLEFECAFYGAAGASTGPSDADMAAFTANPFIAIEAVPSSFTVTTTPGNSTAAGVAAIILAALSISTVPGNSTADGAPATFTNTVPGVVIATTPGNSTAAGAPATFGTFIQTGSIPNNTGTLLASTAVVWTWTPAGRVGSMVGITPVDGTGTTDVNGRLAPGVAVATGRLSIAVRNATAKQDDIFEQYF